MSVIRKGSVTVDFYEYEKAHGEAPNSRRKGTYSFGIGQYQYSFSSSFSFSRQLKCAIDQAKQDKVSYISVLA